jgi:hypothetical protein
MALFDRVAFGRRLRGSAYAGFAVGFLGLAFLVDPFGGGSVDRLGAVAIVAGAATWAAGSLYSRDAPLPRRPLVSAGLASVCGGLLLVVASAVTGELGDAVWTTEALLAVAYLIVVGSFVGFTAYVWLLQVAPTSLVATYAYVNPIVASCVEGPGGRRPSPRRPRTLRGRRLLRASAWGERLWSDWRGHLTHPSPLRERFGDTLGSGWRVAEHPTQGGARPGALSGQPPMYDISTLRSAAVSSVRRSE